VKPTEREGSPPHWACTDCFGRRQISITQFQPGQDRHQRTLPAKPRLIRVRTRYPPLNKSPSIFPSPLGNSFNRATCLIQADGYLSHRTRLATPKRVIHFDRREHLKNVFPEFSPSFWGNFTVCSVLNSGENGSSLPRKCRSIGAFLVLPDRIELSTSPLPKERSAPDRTIAVRQNPQ
jgi:hypothetical protein